MIRRGGHILGLAACLVALVSVILGGHIYRWEMIVWPLIAAFWICTAWIYQRENER
jgi:Ca2+/Na+ antiporter